MRGEKRSTPLLGGILSETIFIIQTTLDYHYHTNYSALTNTSDGCRPCLLRAALNVKTLCTICLETKINMYHLNCGHSLCRPCAVKTTGSNWQHTGMCHHGKCPFCRGRFRLTSGMKESAQGCECDDDYDENDDEGGENEESEDE